MIKREHDTKIRISQLSNGTYTYYLFVDPDELELQDNFKRPVEIDVVLEKTLNQIFLKAEVHTIGLFQCDRCTDDFNYTINNSFGTLYVYDRLDGLNYSEEEICVINHDTVYIDLKDDVRDIVTVAIPLKLLCKENCLGLCPRCGTRLNFETCNCEQDEIDPRWEKLTQIRK